MEDQNYGSHRQYVPPYGSLPDARLSMRQMVGLRFASDEEFGDLCKP